MRKLINTLMRLILLTFAAAILILIGVVIVVSVKHHKKLSEEASILVAPGQMLSVDGRQMHVMTNAAESAVTYVFLHDAKQTDNAIALQPLLHALSDRAWAYVDRSGNGFSESVNAPKDVASMTEETRAALAQAGVEGRLVLVAQGTAGIEAVYWANQYPEEVAGIVGLDATYPAECEEYELTWDTKLVSKTMYLYCKIGGHRYAAGVYPDNDRSLYTDEQMELRNALISARYYNKDTYQELMAVYDNAEAAGAFPTRIPVFMIYSNPLLEPYYGESEETQAEVGEIMEAHPEYDFAGLYNESRKNYFAQFSNASYEEMAGPAGLITYVPTTLAEKIEDFVNNVQKDLEK